MVLLFLFVLCIILFALSLINGEGGVNNEDVGVIFVFIITPFLLIYLASRNLYRIQIVNQCITFKHILTRKETVYNFNELDGYIIDPRGRLNSNPNIVHLIQRGEKVKQISASMYKNYDEIESLIIKRLRLIQNQNIDLF